MNFSNLTRDLFYFIDQDSAKALATIRQVDVNVLNVTRVQESAISNRCVLVLDQHNAVRNINLIAFFLNRLRAHRAYRNVTRLVRASSVT